MKAISFVCLWLFLSTVAALHDKVPPKDVVFIQALADPIKVRPFGVRDNPDWALARKKQDIIWYRDESQEIAIIRAATQPFKINPFDDDPIGCDYFCDDIEVLLPPRPPCFVGNCEFEDTLSKTKYWRMKHRQG